MVETSMTVPALTNAALDRGQGVALWRQISQAVERDIAEGRHAPGSRLPTEAELSARFRVNRHTVRRAMEELEARGLLRIEQGRGSFVAEDVLDYHVGPRTRFSEAVRRQNREPQGRILRIAEILAEGAVAEGLKLRPGRPVVLVERLAMADGRPVVIGTHHFPLPRFAELPRLMAEQSSITVAMAACGVPDYRRHSTRITSRLPEPEEAELLQQGRMRPVLVAEAVNVDPAGVPVDYTVARYAAARVQLVVEG
jgi:GntR family phosphonate transport system transcriptional regulator